jgi:hypothetical protein
MKKNVGMIDKAIRVSTALIVGGLYFDGRLSGTWATILLIVSGIFVLTSFISFCPLYAVLKFNTRRKGL